MRLEIEFVGAADAAEVTGAGLFSSVETGVTLAPVFSPTILDALVSAIGVCGWKARLGKCFDFATAPPNARRIVLLGLGDSNKATRETLEIAGAHLVKHLLTGGVESVSVQVPEIGGLVPDEAAVHLAIGAQLAAYRFDDYRSRLLEAKPDTRCTLRRVYVVTSKPQEAKRRWESVQGTIAGTLWARDLVNEPPNILHPREFARRLERLSRLGVEVSILDQTQLRALGMEALLGVGRGSPHETLLAVMEWRGGSAGTAPVGLIGKGVTFDTGGVSIKSADGMQEMKADMGGAAAVVGAMHALAAREARSNVVGIIGVVENATDGGAQRPGDIVKSMSGQTIEIINTDAEGRLVLCDAMRYAQEKFNPRAMIDLATLTGSIMLALGYGHAGLFSNDDELAAAITAAGKAASEPVWRMPLGPEYDKALDSTFADMRNGAGRLAGAITAAQFLKRFVKDGTRWAHIDMASTVQAPTGDFRNEDPRLPSWATGWGVRLLDRLIADHFEDGAGRV